MGTVSTSSNAFPLERPNLPAIDRDPATGYQYAHFRSSTANRFDTFVSTDGGATWASFATITRTAVQEMSGIWVTDDGGIIWLVRTNESSEDRIYIYRLDIPTATWSSNVLLANPGNGGVAGAFHSGLSFAVARGGSEIYVGVAVGLNNVSSKTGINLYGAQIHADHTIIKFNAIFSGTRTKYETGTTGRITPSVDIEHGGDGKTAGTPHLWVTYGRLKLVAMKCTWNGGGWTVPTAGVQLAVPVTALEQASGRWDGNELVTVRPHSSSTVQLTQLNRAGTTISSWTTAAHPQGTVKNCAVNYDSSTGNARVFAVGTSTNDLYWCDFTRATLTFGAWTLFSATDIESTRRDQYAIRAGTTGSSAHDCLSVADTTGVISSTALPLAYNPTAPTWVAPTSGAAADVAASLLLDWLFNDPNPGDTQGSYAVSRQIGAGALAYWRASDSTWQPAEVQNSSGTTALTLASSWGADPDAAYTFKVKTWDAGGLPGPYSDGMVVIPSAKVNPTITAPAPAAVLTSNSVTLTWTVAAETAYRVQLTQTSGGSVTYDSGPITGTDLTFTPPTILPTATGWTASLTTWNAEGLASTVQTVAFTVSYVAPMTPTLVCTPAPASGWIAVAITNPAPSGGAPVVSDQDLYRRKVGDTSTGTLVASGLASGATYNDWQAASGVAYEYRSQVFGVNGTSSFSAWTG
jgi:hypothetical protein